MRQRHEHRDEKKQATLVSAFAKLVERQHGERRAPTSCRRAARATRRSTHVRRQTARVFISADAVETISNMRP